MRHIAGVKSCCSFGGCTGDCRSGQLCGDRGGEATLVEVVAGQPVVLVVQTQSPAWRWNIAVTQVSEAAPVLLPAAPLLQVSRQEIAMAKQDLQQVASCTSFKHFVAVQDGSWWWTAT